MTPVDPMPHQWEAIEEIVSRSALLVHHGTGTGKTRSAIEAIDVIVGAGEIPILHVVPNSLIEQTIEEYATWLGREWGRKHLAVLDGSLSISRREEILAGTSVTSTSVYLLSTEALSYKQIREGIRRRDWGAAFIDEGSRFRNYSARTRTLQVLGRRARSRYVFSGNIMPRNPADLWYIMNFLVPGIFGTRNIWTFQSEYCVLGGFTGMQVMGVRPDKIDKLKALIDAHSIRAELSDIRSDMPTRSLTVRKVPLKTGTQAETYRQMRDTLRAEIERMSAEEFRTQASTYSVRLLRLQEISAGFSRNVEGDVEFFGSNKTDEMLDMLQDTPDQSTIVWYWWTPELKLIEAKLASAGLPYITFTKAGDG
jgi:SNF2 family DNA or RNA helicase